jgi:hypothetical protein
MAFDRAILEWWMGFIKCKHMFTSVRLSVFRPFHVLEDRTSHLTCCKWNEEWCVVVHVTKMLDMV